jgi:hypothetical protein
LDPSQNGGVYDRDTALRHKIAHVAITQLVSDIPSYGLNDKLDFVHFVTPALAPASQNGQSQRHFSMSSLDNDVEKYQAPNGAA